MRLEIIWRSQRVVRGKKRTTKCSLKRRATTIGNTKALENNTNMHDQVSQACSDSDRDQDSTAEKNVEGSAKHNLDIRVSSSEIESVEPLKPESDRSNIFHPQFVLLEL
nr:BPK_HP1_G0043820.mRNA.1.CDS.1 [Saccharomyces cerevisiae]